MNDNGLSHDTVLHGQEITLIPASRDHRDAYLRWFNDFNVQRTSGMLPMPWSHSRLDRWLTRRVFQSEDAIWFTISEKQDGRPVGFAGVRDIDSLHRTAEYFITVGEADCRGKGVGTEATRLTLEYAFAMLNLNSVFLDVSSASLAGIRAYEKAGFHEIGRRRESLIMGGNTFDWVYMECLSNEHR